MLVFGVDIPLVEVVISLSVIIIIVLIEVIIIVSLMLKQMNKSKELTQLLENLSETILSIKKVEIEELDKLRKR
jgi:hypothetical protein